MPPRAAAGRPRSRSPSPARTPAEDEARLEAVRDALGPDGLVRIDANGGWSVDEAVAGSACWSGPPAGWSTSSSRCASVEDLAVVRRRVDVPIAADESIRRAEDPYRVRDLEAADIAVLKVQPLGGVRACLRIAEDIGLPVVVSAARWSRASGSPPGSRSPRRCPSCRYACGLATVQLLTDDVVADPLLPVDGPLPVVRPEVDVAALDRLLADPARARGMAAAGGRGRRAGQDRCP